MFAVTRHFLFFDINFLISRFTSNLSLVCQVWQLSEGVVSVGRQIVLAVIALFHRAALKTTVLYKCFVSLRFKGGHKKERGNQTPWGRT